MDNPFGLGSILPRPLLARSAPWEIERSARDSARGVLVYIYIYILVLKDIVYYLFIDCAAKPRFRHRAMSMNVAKQKSKCMIRKCSQTFHQNLCLVLWILRFFLFAKLRNSTF